VVSTGVGAGSVVWLGDEVDPWVVGVELSLFVEEVGVTDSEGVGDDVEVVLSVGDTVGEGVGVLV
jgi:hypothetical protein